jgi:hypothetical protein
VTALPAVIGQFLRCFSSNTLLDFRGLRIHCLKPESSNPRKYEGQNINVSTHLLGELRALTFNCD